VIAPEVLAQRVQADFSASFPKKVGINSVSVGNAISRFKKTLRQCGLWLERTRGAKGIRGYRKVPPPSLPKDTEEGVTGVTQLKLPSENKGDTLGDALVTQPSNGVTLSRLPSPIR
jgi:hypothetical protein